MWPQPLHTDHPDFERLEDRPDFESLEDYFDQEFYEVFWDLHYGLHIAVAQAYRLPVDLLVSHGFRIMRSLPTLGPWGDLEALRDYGYNLQLARMPDVVQSPMQDMCLSDMPPAAGKDTSSKASFKAKAKD